MLGIIMSHDPPEIAEFIAQEIPHGDQSRKRTAPVANDDEQVDREEDDELVFLDPLVHCIGAADRARVSVCCAER